MKYFVAEQPWNDPYTQINFDALAENYWRLIQVVKLGERGQTLQYIFIKDE